MKQQSYFATLFDINYLTRGLLLYESLQKNCPAARMYILCLDGACRDALLKLALKNVVLVSLDELEAYDPALLRVKFERTWPEYIFTLFATWALYVYDRLNDGDSFLYIDSDCCFFSNPAPLFDVLLGVLTSCASVPHAVGSPVTLLAVHALVALS